MPQGTIATVLIDEQEVRAIEGSVTTRLSGTGTASCRVPITEAIGGAGSMMKVYLENDDLGTSPVLWHHGRVLTCEDSADENSGYTVYNSHDPLELWPWRPVRDNDGTGDFSNPTIIKDNVTGPQIIQEMILASDPTQVGSLNSGDDNTEGPLRLQMGNFAVGGVDLTGTPTDWPMTMADLASLLVSTGEVDIVVSPIEYDADFNYGRIDVFNGNFGDDLTTSVAFQYGMGAHNIRAFRRNEDMTRLCNKLWYYLGPRRDQQHWQGNVTATDTSGFSDCGMSLDDIHDCLAISRGEVTGTMPDFGSGTFDPTFPGSFDVRMEVRTYDDRNNEATLGFCLFRRLWAIEQFLRCQPLTLVHITPTRDTAIGSFNIGDLVLVEISPALRDGSSGAQRVYQYTVSWDTDSVPAIGELQVSSDNEGFSTT